MAPVKEGAVLWVEGVGRGARGWKAGERMAAPKETEAETEEVATVLARGVAWDRAAAVATAPVKAVDAEEGAVATMAMVRRVAGREALAREAVALAKEAEGTTGGQAASGGVHCASSPPV